MFLELQKFLYTKLSKDKSLSQGLRIFSQVPKDTPFPYLYLGKFTVINSSLKGCYRMHSVNEIHLYSQDNSIEEILNWMDGVKNILRLHDVSLKGLHISEVEFLQMTVDVMQDAKTHRAVSKFRVIMEDGNGSTQRFPNVA